MAKEKQKKTKQEESAAKEKAAESKKNGQQAKAEAAEEQATDTAVAEEENEQSQLQKELEERKDKYLRLYSEYENHRRRTAKEKLEMTKTATASLMTDLLPVLDDFARAQKNNEKDGVSVEEMREGFTLIQQKLQRILENKGLKPIEITIGDDFDTETQEAITQIPAPEEKLKGKVVDVVEQGYYLGDRVVRYAKVVTGA